MGAKELAIRKNLPVDILALTVIKPIFEKLYALYKNSLLTKSLI